MKHLFLYRWLTAVCFFGMLAIAPGAWAQNYTSGNLVVLQVGDGSAALTGAATVVVLKEYTTATGQSTPVSSLTLPTTVSGANKRLTLSGSATSEGLLSRSANGQYLFLGGYDAAPGTASISGSTGSTINRTVGRISATGTIDVSTALTDFSSGNNPRGATSTNGTDIWVTGGAGGVRYATLGSNTSTQLSTTLTNLRQVSIFNGQLYVSTGSGSAVRIGTVGTGTPTTSGQTITNLPGFPTTGSPYAFFFADLDAGVPGLDVLYVADDGAGLLKYSLVGGNWVANGTVGASSDTYRGLTGTVNGTTVNLFATRKSSEFVSLTDASGYNGAFTGTPTLLATAPANTAFRGVAFAPTAPCPAIIASLTGTTTICTGSSINLTATVSDGTAPYSLTYSNGTSTSVVSGTTISVSPTTSTTYTIVGLKDFNGCTATTSGTAIVTVNPQPTTSSAGTSQTITTGTTATLAANSPTTGTGSWSVTSGPSTSLTQFSSTTSPTATFMPAGGPGDYVLTWTISNAPCSPSSSNVTISVVNPVVNLSVSSNTASETSPTAITVTATASAPVVGDQTVSLAVTGTGITAGDYTLSGTTITIPNGQTAGSVTFTVIDDNAVEGTETAVLTISTPSGGIALGTTTTQNITITDNDFPPGLSISDVTLAEGNAGTTTFSFTVSLATPAPAGGVTFDIATADNTATQPSDYTAKSLTGQTIPAGSSTYTFDVLVNGDLIFEPDETFYVNVSNVTGATVSKGQGTGTITNDDPQPFPDLTIALTDTPDPVIAGSSLTYSFTVSNTGTADAANTSITFPLPAGTTFTSLTAPAGWSATTPTVGASGTVAVGIASLTVGSQATFALVVTPTVANPTLTATVSVSTTTLESNMTNNLATTTTKVTPANQPPVAPTFVDQMGIVAVPYSYTVPAFTDPENQPLTYSITGLPAGLTADNITRVISGTPTTTGFSTVTVVASDPQSATTAGTFSFTVNANVAPTPSTVANQTATAGVAFSLTVPAFSDPENQPLTYAATGVPSPLTFDPATRILSGTSSTTGVSTITITATDPASNTASITFTLSVTATPAAGVIRITEYMYSSNNGAGNGAGEFVELTNVGNAPIDLTGWSFDDNTRLPGSFTGISGFGIVQPNESVIITDATAQQFRTFWYLPLSVKVAGGNDQNLGRSDEINIYDNTNALVTRLTYNDQGTNPAGTVRTQFISAWPQRNLLGQTNTGGWQLSVANDAQNSYVATTGDLGNPGGYFIPLPRVKVVESAGTTSVTEGGNTDTYTIALNSQPTSDVMITITPGSQLTLNTTTLTFTPANYSTVQTVTVTAVDDAIYQGAPRSVTITQAATSSDGAYNGLAVNPVSVTIIDNDIAATAPPVIQVAGTTTAYLSLPANGPGYVSGVADDPTDPATTLGVNFTLTDADTDVNSLTVTASSNSANATLNLTGSGSTRNLKITPGGVGYATITVSVMDGSNTANYVINYAASAASATQNTTQTRFHTGTSDASTAVLIDANYYLEGDDENQVLRLYNRQNSGLPVAGFDYTSMLGLTDILGGIPREVDIEASIRQGNRIFWIGSQSNKELGPARPNRDRVFATDISGSGAGITLSYVGRYDYLKEDIIAWDVNNVHGKGANYYGLQQSADAATNSKAPEGYNIEGAELAPDGTTAYIGFRAPQILPANRTKALIVAVTNLTSLVSGQPQGSATFGAPIELDLGGRGIREIRKNANNDYVIIAGPAGDATGIAPADFKLYTWTGNPADAPVLRVTDPTLTSINANGSFESIIEVPNPLTNASQLQLVVDNGDAAYYGDGTAAKDLPQTQNNFKKFRSDIVTLGAPFNTAPTVANAIGPQSTTVGTAYTLSLANVFTDAETPNSLTLAVSGLPAGLSFVSPSTISGTPSTTVGSPFSVSVTATDPGNLSASTAFTLTVSPAPVVTPLALSFTASPDMLLTTGTTTLSATVSGGTTPYTYTFSGPGTINPSGNTASVSNIPAGVQTFTVVVSDATSPTAQTISGTVSVTVNQANTAPVATANANQTATVGVGFSYTVNAFTDSEMPNSLTYSASISPANGFSFDANTHIISGTPSVSGVSSVSVTATDPGSLSASTTFTITVNPASVTPPPTGPFSITGVTTISCETISAGERRVSFNPRYAGLDGSPVSFSVVNELAATTNSGPYTLRLYTDNPVITLSATQSGANFRFAYNWLSACSSSTGNTAPTVANPVPPQSATVGLGYTLSLAGVFTDAETPNGLTLSVMSLPSGLNFVAPSTISGTPSMSGGASVTVTATDPGGLTATNTFTITVSPAGGTPPPPSGTFSITSVQTISCEVLSPGQRRLTFNPQYAGLNGAPVSFSVVNELAATTNPGPYSLNLYTDNPVVTLQAIQSGISSSYAYNWLSVCSSSTGNTAPTVANPVPPQSATVGVGYTLSLVNVFTDAETPNQLTLSVVGLPAGLSFTAPSTISGTPSLSGVSSVTVTATDPGSLSASTTFTLMVSPSGGTPPPPPSNTFSITGVTTISCEVISAGERRVTFTPQYAGLDGSPVSFSVVNELAATTNPGPYTLRLYTDNPVITLRAVQSGVGAGFAYSWLTACNPGARVGAERLAPLHLQVLGNPVRQTLEVAVTGAEGSTLRLQLADSQGRVVGQQSVDQAGSVERVRFSVSQLPAGVLILRANTSTQSQTIRVVKVE